MTSTRTVLIVLLLCVLAAPGMVGDALAEPFPAYFVDGWVGFLCLTAVPPGGGPTSVLLQLNFDKTEFGGISQARADALVSYVVANLGVFNPIIGSNIQVTCSRTVTQILADFPGATALQAAQTVSPIFQQLGFARYVIADAYLNFAVLYFGLVQTLKTDVFVVNGSNNLSYAASHEIANTLVP